MFTDRIRQDTGELDYFQLKALVFNGNEKAMFELFDAGILHYRYGWSSPLLHFQPVYGLDWQSNSTSAKSSTVYTSGCSLHTLRDALL